MTAPAAARPPDLSQFGVHLARRAPWNRGEHRVEDLEHPRALFLRELPRPRRVFSDRLTNDAALRFVQTRGGALERRDGIVIERERHAYHTMQYRTIPESARPRRALAPERQRQHVHNTQRLAIRRHPDPYRLRGAVLAPTSGQPLPPPRFSAPGFCGSRPEARRTYCISWRLHHPQPPL